MSIIDDIRHRQSLLDLSDMPPPEHRPEILYIGCVDARLDPVSDIGIAKGKAAIFRNIAALVLKNGVGVEMPQEISIGATLDLFLGRVLATPGEKKHIVVSGHTDCAGLKACLANSFAEYEHFLPLYLSPLNDVRDRVLCESKTHSHSDAETLHALEQATVRKSVGNLLTYPSVQRALAEDKVEIHGWILNTANGTIQEMDPVTKTFAPMRAASPAAAPLKTARL